MPLLLVGKMTVRPLEDTIEIRRKYSAGPHAQALFEFPIAGEEVNERGTRQAEVPGQLVLVQFGCSLPSAPHGSHDRRRNPAC